MNENIDLLKFLKDCPKGWKFYSDVYGEVIFWEFSDLAYPIEINTKNHGAKLISEKGEEIIGDGKCILFPSEDQRDWSKFTAPWYQNEKKEKFDPRTLVPFDKILVRDSRVGTWFAAQFSHIAFDLSEYDLDDCDENLDFIICTTGSADFSYCIPYNDDTKSLVGTTDDAPEIYKYWED